MKNNFRSSLLAFAFCGIALALVEQRAGLFENEKLSLPKSLPEPAGANRENPITFASSNTPTGEILYLFDRSAMTGSLLFSKNRSQKYKAGFDPLTGNDLWMQDAQGKERFIAEEVVSAKFSPDGNNIAYATSEHDLFIETLSGDALAQIPRACDPVWRPDSAAVSFSAMPALDYPELLQSALYDLKSGQISQLGNGN